MARGGITKDEVRKARDSILVKGENPSIDTIRAELGNTGSKTTIHRYLKELEEEESTRLDDEALLSHTLKEMVSKIASRLHQEANTIVEEAKTFHQKQQIEWKEQSATLENALSEAEKRISSLENQLIESEQKLSVSNENLHESTIEEQRLVQEVSDKEDLIEEKNNQILSLEEKHQHSRETHEHYRRSVKEQRDQDQRRHEQQTQELQAEQRQLKQTISIKLGEVTQLNKENARFIEKANQNVKQISILTAESKTLEEQLKATEGRVISLTTHLSEKELSIEKHTESISSLEVKLSKSEKVRKGLDIELAEIKAELKIKNQLYEKFELKNNAKSKG